VLAHYGVNDITYNHFSLRVPGEKGLFLVKPTDWMFSEVTASSLHKFDFDGNPIAPHEGRNCVGGALIIHAGLAQGARRSQRRATYSHAQCNGSIDPQIWAVADQPAFDAVLWRAEIS
jgi:hypothetical protein